MLVRRALGLLQPQAGERVADFFCGLGNFTLPMARLGAQAMGGGNLMIGAFCISWPTGEFGGMGLEGKVKLGHQRAFAAIQDPAERVKLYEKLVAEEYERGKALNVGSLYEVDDVIDPAETRKWIVAGLRAMPPVAKREGKKRGWVDAW